MTDITLVPITSGYNLSKVNANFAEVQEAINEDVLHRQGGNNTMLQQLDMNGQRVLNLGAPVNPNDAARLQDVIAVDSGDALQLKTDLANSSDPAKGAGMVGWTRSGLSSAITTVHQMLDGQAVNIWEYAALAIGYTPGGNPNLWDWTPAIQAALNSFGSPLVAPPMTGGGLVVVPPMPGGGTYKHTGLSVPVRVSLKGYGWASILENTGTGHALSYIGTSLIRHVDQHLSDIRIMGNTLSLDGVHLEFTASRGTGGTGAGTAPGVGVSSVILISNCKIDSNGRNGVQYGQSASVGAGNKLLVSGCYIGDNLSHGVLVTGQSNIATVSNCSIVYNTLDGVQFNQVASTCTVTQNFIADNGRFGVHAFRAEQPMITHNGFNRNAQGAVVLNGDPVGSPSEKYTEAAMIFANLFGDNGKSSATPREVQVRASRGTNIIGNYFFATGTPTMIYINDYAEGVAMSGNHFKDLTTEVKLEVKVAATNAWYTFDDDVTMLTRQVTASQPVQHIIGPNVTLFQTRLAEADSSPRFRITGGGLMEWASGSAPSDVSISRVNAGALRVGASVEMNRCEIAEGLAAPGNKTGYARIYVDGTGGTAAVRIRFTDGTVKTFTLV